jgi:hypothetical protein
VSYVRHDKGEVVPKDRDVGVVGPVAGFGDGQGAFGQRPGLPRLPQCPQDEGEIAQIDGDVGVVGSVAGFADGQGAFGQRPGLPRLPQVLQDEGEVV